ncbi:hypothetical protein Terro_1436 [Terriglobus roseus DSM 18391]|uniref:Aspartyl protease n=1 Tax=Terriglobus roseus (strain DSM 18391 / NRRL B-41598 / KBS 63) TaxID=926566 RepID=I3ZES6_TERRK|nr:aspartyl protease family protein [Terriglobus roseus]AFL87744.1 hypothetical protein Terro_1436 [Terriglobus roseus DSM 18391]
MRLIPLIALQVILVMVHGLQAQSPEALKAAYDAKHVFALRDAVAHSSAPRLYKGAVDASANRVQTATKELQAVIQHDPHSDEAYEAHDLLGNLYFRNGMYREGYGEIVAALRESPNASDAKSMLSIFTALNELPKMSVVEMKPTSMAIEPGSLSLPFQANGKDLKFFFDTGAAISIMGESEAKELGILAKPVEGKMNDSSGRGVSGLRVALVSDLRIGGLHLRNVPFLVIADSGEPWTHAPKNERGIIGLPLLIAMRTFRWTPEGRFEFGLPAGKPDINTCNMLFHNSSPVVDVLVEGMHLDFTLDTGAVDTDLNPPFAKALPDLMKSGQPEERALEGLGGKVVNASLLLPSVTFAFGGKSLALSPAHVFTEHGNGAWAPGNLGMDLLRQARAFTVDFEAMTLRLE